MKYEIELTAEQIAVLETDMIDIQQWLDNVISNKARKVTDRIVEKSGRGSKFTKKEEKEKIISDLISEKSELFKTAVEKNIEAEQNRRVRGEIGKD